MADISLDKFGQFIVEHLRDKGIYFGDELLNRQWKAPALQKIQKELGSLSDHQRAIIHQAIVLTVDNAIHDFLFALQDTDDVQIAVDGKNIVDLSDGIHGESYTEDGWNAKFSKYESYV